MIVSSEDYVVRLYGLVLPMTLRLRCFSLGVIGPVTTDRKEESFPRVSDHIGKVVSRQLIHKSVLRSGIQYDPNIFLVISL